MTVVEIQILEERESEKKDSADRVADLEATCEEQEERFERVCKELEQDLADKEAETAAANEEIRKVSLPVFSQPLILLLIKHP